MSAQKIGEMSIKLAGAAIEAHSRGDEFHAIFFAMKAAEFFAMKAAETLELAKALGWKLAAQKAEIEHLKKEAYGKCKF